MVRIPTGIASRSNFKTALRAGGNRKKKGRKFMGRESELEDFKKVINLSHYAAGQGYELDRSSSSRNSAIMQSGADKIVIARNTNNHWIYFSVSDENDNGSIIDFVQNRQRMDLGQVRKELRPWLNGSAHIPSIGVGNYAAQLLPIAKDIASVRARFVSMEILNKGEYLEQNRGIPHSFIFGDRFSGRIYQDVRENSIFPHVNDEGICGYEVKNLGFTGFAPAGEKGLWHSNLTKEDTCLVIGEAAIDVLSFAALHPDPKARYVSTGGSLNDKQPELIRRAVDKMPEGAKIILATDNDEAGEALASKIKALISPLIDDKRFLEILCPQGRGDDWNDVLRASMEGKTMKPFPCP